MHPTAVPGPQRVLPGLAAWPVHDSAATRAVESAAMAGLAPHTLMQRAGLAVARLALAVAPHAGRFWVAAGPGNNGGDGLVAARLLQQAGRAVSVSLLGRADALPADAAAALAQAQQAGVAISGELPAEPFDLGIDALLGLGSRRAPEGALAQAVALLNRSGATCLAVDLPTGLDADSGRPMGSEAVRAQHCLALLTLKPGLFTGQGRDHAGQVWLDTLGVALGPTSLRLSGAADALAPQRRHQQHKGSFGDLWVVGGAAGMAGAALLAARAALAAGAGRVFVASLDDAAPALDAQRPELMFRPQAWQQGAAAFRQATVVCGCGGGSAVRQALPALLAGSERLVLDADALNALATDEAVRTQLRARAARGQATVLTPHPLEAARLLQADTAAVQADRLGAARTLAARHACVVVLKGSGTVVAAADGQAVINPSGNALLAAPGTGDVLAGWLGGAWSARGPADSPALAALQAAVAAVWLHGHAADRAAAQGQQLPLRAADLADAMREAALSLPAAAR